MILIILLFCNMDDHSCNTCKIDKQSFARTYGNILSLQRKTIRNQVSGNPDSDSVIWITN